MRTLKVIPNNPHDFNNVLDILDQSGFCAIPNKLDKSFSIEEEEQFIDVLEDDISELFDAMSMPVNLEIG